MVWPRRLIPSFLYLVAFLFCSTAAEAQQALERPLRVYLDCNGFYCDLNYFIEEVSWVDFVRDRQDADVHVLAVRQATGSGGSSYTAEFRGRGAFDGQTITLRRATTPDATESMVRDTLVAVVELGLAPFASLTAAPPQVQIRPPPASADTAAKPNDPWNRWTFALSVYTYMNGESQQGSLYETGAVSADRVTDAWKIKLRGLGSFERDRYRLPDSTSTFRTESYSASALVGRSVATHWALGGIATWERSTYYNYRTSMRAAPAVEYDVFPYSKSVRKLLTLLYSIGPRYNDYDEVTIFGQTSEAVLEQSAVLSCVVTQPWGSIDAALRATHYIARLSGGNPWPSAQYNARLIGGFEVRVVKGLSVDVSGYLDAVRGQIQLRAADLTEAEILTRQRELATDYRYYMSLGLSYRFGSIFNSVVNPRFNELY